jgi:molybdopterin molybdotransferase
LPEGFLKLIDVDEALARLLEALPEEPRSHETVVAGEAVGRVCARNVVAGEDLPGFDRSSMDGYAVKASDTFGASEGLPAYLELKGEVQMGAATSLKVAAGETAGISTGAVMPEGADAVVMVELTQQEGTSIEVLRPVAPGENVIRRDEDVPAGAVAVGKGRCIGAGQVGVLAALGILEVEVFARPVIGVISTGDELVEVEDSPGPGQVRDVNSAALSAAIEIAGCEAKRYGIVGDELEVLLEVSRRALVECDAVIISGGSSAGVRDVTVDVISRLGSPGLLAHGIYLKPGKPTLVGVCDGRPVLGFPGNPASAIAVFNELFEPMLGRLKGLEQVSWTKPVKVVRAVMERPVSSGTGRLELVPVTLREESGKLLAAPVPGRPNLIGTLARARGNVRIPKGVEGIAAGAEVEVEMLD